MSTEKTSHFLTLLDFDKAWIEDVLHKALQLKQSPENYSNALRNKTLAMVFMKTSTRTRCSFEAGMTQLGGHAIFLDVRSTQFGLGKIADETKCIARYADVIMARVFGHEQVETMATAADESTGGTVPIINGLSNTHHPCQALADLLTILEKKGKKGSLKGVTVSFLGVGSNVCNSLLIGCAKLGARIRVATPKGHEPLKAAIAVGNKTGNLTLTNKPEEAVKNADVVYTDTWLDMQFFKEGKVLPKYKKEYAKQKKKFKPYQVNMKLVNKYCPKAIIMHDLPAHRGYEISDDAMDSKNSVVFDQAENRMHAQKALMLKLLGKF